MRKPELSLWGCTRKRHGSASRKVRQKVATLPVQFHTISICFLLDPWMCFHDDNDDHLAEPIFRTHWYNLIIFVILYTYILANMYMYIYTGMIWRTITETYKAANQLRSWSLQPTAAVAGCWPCLSWGSSELNCEELLYNWHRYKLYDMSNY